MAGVLLIFPFLAEFILEDAFVARGIISYRESGRMFLIMCQILCPPFGRAKISGPFDQKMLGNAS